MLQAEAKKCEFSEGAKFMKALRGLKVYYFGKLVDKWELWALGYRNAELIKMGLSDNIEVRRRDGINSVIN